MTTDPSVTPGLLKTQVFGTKRLIRPTKAKGDTLARQDRVLIPTPRVHQSIRELKGEGVSLFFGGQAEKGQEGKSHNLKRVCFTEWGGGAKKTWGGLEL